MSDRRGMQRVDNYEAKVYVGNLGDYGDKGELDRAFSKYGPVRSVWVAQRPTGFAFIEMEDPRDAEDAVKALDGREICGQRVRVEMRKKERRTGGDDRDRRRRYSRSRSRDRRRRYSRSRSRDRRRTPSYSPRRDRRSRSRSDSRDRRRDSRSRSRSR